MWRAKMKQFIRLESLHIRHLSIFNVKHVKNKDVELLGYCGWKQAMDGN